MENDKADLTNYIGKDQALKDKKMKQEKTLVAERTGKDEMIKHLETKISTLKSDIDKQRESLNGLR